MLPKKVYVKYEDEGDGWLQASWDAKSLLNYPDDDKETVIGVYTLLRTEKYTINVEAVK